QELNTLGSYSIKAYATASPRSADLLTPTAPGTPDSFRGYLDGVARFQLDENWSVSGSLRLTTDRTFLRRYDISQDDRLRTTANVERIDTDSYFSI
ncbi:LPS assembly protein LptD, partial [Acinetobacter baumannii]